MSTKAKFVALLTVTVILMSFLIKSHSFSASHKKNPQPADTFTAIVIVGVFAGLVMIVVLALYFRDIPSSKKRFERDGSFTLRHFMVSFLFGLILSVLFKLFFTGPNVAKRFTNETANCTPVNGLALNCTVPSVGPLSTSGNNSGLEYSSSPVTTHLWMVFLVPVFFAFLYLGYHYYRLGRGELKRKKKIERAIEFDRKLDELGLERFSSPKEAIVEIYKNAVLWLEDLGIPYRESWTHWEHAEHVKYMHEAFVELTRLFEKAKYAPERLGWGDAERALEVYKRLRGKAREVVES